MTKRVANYSQLNELGYIMRLVVFISLAIISYYIASDIYTPSMPTIAGEFACHRDIVQKTLSYFLMGSVFSCFFSGALADRFGNRKVIIAGLIVTLIGTVIAAFSTSINQLIAARFLQGLGGVIAKIVGLSIIHSSTTETKATKLFGLMGFYFAVIPAIAPIAGGFINDHLGWRFSFYVLAMLFIFALGGVLKVVPPDVPSKSKTESALFPVHDYYTMLKHRPFMAAILVTPLFVAGEWFMISFLPFYFQQELGFTSENYGLYLGFLIPWYAAGSYLAGKYGERFGMNKLIDIALILGMVTALLLTGTTFLASNSATLIYIILSLYMIGYGILFPTTTTKVFGYFPHLKATVSALRTLFGALFALIGAQLAEMLNEARFIHFALFFCTSSLAAWILFKTRREA